MATHHYLHLLCMAQSFLQYILHCTQYCTNPNLTNYINIANMNSNSTNKNNNRGNKKKDNSTIIPKKKQQYVNLKIDGKLFPTWILANFKEYQLPEIVTNTDDDPCNRPITNKELWKYQAFLAKYLDYNSPYRDILIYHGLGSGKTRTTINIYNVLYNNSPYWNVFILLRATMKESIWTKELDKWLQQDEKEFRLNNIQFISYDAPNADKIFLEKVKNADSAKKYLYIFEEVHNFINNVYNNIVSQHGHRALTIYDHIIQQKKNNDDVRVIAISGSPAINYPFELAILFNLLRPGIFPRSESQFNDMYVSNGTYQTINPATKNTFQRRIMGLVSYYVGSTPDYYAKKVPHYVYVQMSEYQNEVYKHFEELENRLAKKKKSSGNYRSYTRQACNFVFPLMGQFSGETRPRPKDFKINEAVIEKYTNGDVDKKDPAYYKVEEYFGKLRQYESEFDKFLQKNMDNDLKTNYTLANDITNILSIPNFDVNSYTQYINDTNKTGKISSILTVMNMCSAKMTFMVLNLLTSKGPVLVYSNYVLMEGLDIFKIYLKYFGFVPLDISAHSHEPNGFRYTEYHGQIDMINRRKTLDIFNQKENRYGEICKIILVSPAGSEGLNLFNIRQVHLMEPYWHEVRMEQMVGRAIRQCSHKDIPMNERIVDVYRYKSIRRSTTENDELTSSQLSITNRMTTDQYIETAARSKQGLIESFLDTIKEVSIDCVLNKNHNDLQSKVKCFQFDEQSLFEKTIGPAYKEDIRDDIKMNNGLNSVNSVVNRIKVIKIKAVIQITKDPPTYSAEENYWYNPTTMYVYDFKLHNLIGKVGATDEGFPMKLNQFVYVITHMIPVPKIRQGI